MSAQDLRQNPMMAHLLEALDAGRDIGHYGRLVFTMVARHFLSEKEVVGYLAKDRDFDAGAARSLYHQVESRDYSPPRPDRIHEWQAKQEFPICPNVKDPDACNVYKDLSLPEAVYEQINEYHEQKAEAESA